MFLPYLEADVRRKDMRWQHGSSYNEPPDRDTMSYPGYQIYLFTSIHTYTVTATHIATVMVMTIALAT